MYTAEKTLHSCPCVSMAVLQNAFGQNIKIFCERVGTLGDSHRRGAARLRSCRHAATRMHRPARRKVGKTRLLADWQTGSCLAESSARTRKVMEHLPKIGDFNFLHIGPHARGHGEGVLKIEQTPMIPPARARGWVRTQF